MHPGLLSDLGRLTCLVTVLASRVLLAGDEQQEVFKKEVALGAKVLEWQGREVSGRGGR